MVRVLDGFEILYERINFCGKGYETSQEKKKFFFFENK